MNSTRATRQRILALTPYAELDSAWQRLALRPRHRPLRPAETGLALLRGRIGGSGSAFNLGEMTLSRASIALDSGELGHGWVAGRDLRHAELIALVDACVQCEPWAARIDAELIAPLAERLATRHQQASREAAATRVDFFTLVRGD